MGDIPTHSNRKTYKKLARQKLGAELSAAPFWPPDSKCEIIRGSAPYYLAFWAAPSGRPAPPFAGAHFWGDGSGPPAPHAQTIAGFARNHLGFLAPEGRRGVWGGSAPPDGSPGTEGLRPSFPGERRLRLLGGRRPPSRRSLPGVKRPAPPGVLRPESAAGAFFFTRIAPLRGAPYWGPPGPRMVRPVRTTGFAGGSYRSHVAR